MTATYSEAARPRYVPASRFSITGFGFYIYLLSDVILFSALFAAYAVLHGATAGGPTGREVFSLPTVALETGCLLTSSYVCGLGMQAAEHRNKLGVMAMLAAVFVLGAAFLGLEISEFSRMAHEGAGPDRSAFLSAFFALVGAHGVHITVGLVWIAVLAFHLRQMDFSPSFQRRLFCFSLFWHVLDIVWIAIFTFVYLLGVQGA
jgi:cytochrome o ubiquinol oxidase subunit III